MLDSKVRAGVRTFANTATVISVAFFFPCAMAAGPNFLWNSAVGFKTAENCAAITALPNPAFRKFEHRVVEITDTQLSEGYSPFTVVGSFWQPVDSGISTLRCREGGISKDYSLFDVFRGESSTRIARVGISAEDAGLFKFIRLHSTAEAERAIRAPSPAREKTGITSGIRAFDGSLEYVVCGATGEVAVLNERLQKVLFSAQPFETVVPFQSFGGGRSENSDAQGHQFTRVQFPMRAQSMNAGWVSAHEIQLRSQCELSPATEIHAEMSPTVSAWTFPTGQRATANYKTGMRRFSAGRANGRLHAACDLYRVTGEPALAANSGTVIRDRYYFYEGTYALEVHHADGKVIRYGEILGKAAPGVGMNSSVNPDQTVGYIGKVNSGCCEPMLHFEMYSGTASGPLTQSGTKFVRRKDLLDPSAYLTDWEKLKFGKSY